MNVGIRHGSSESETKTYLLLIELSIARELAFCTGSPSPNSHKTKYTVGCITEDIDLGGQEPFTMNNDHAYLLLQRKPLSLSFSTTSNIPFTPEGDASSTWYGVQKFSPVEYSCALMVPVSLEVFPFFFPCLGLQFSIIVSNFNNFWALKLGNL